MVYLITYDLCGKDKGYSELARAITNAAHKKHLWICDSAWLIQSTCSSAEEVYNQIKSPIAQCS